MATTLQDAWELSRGDSGLAVVSTLRTELAGPDELDAEELRLLLREIFTAAGGSHDDWAEYDRVMREQRRTAVLVRPLRTYSN